MTRTSASHQSVLPWPSVPLPSTATPPYTPLKSLIAFGSPPKGGGLVAGPG